MADLHAALWRLLIRADISTSAYTRDLFFAGCRYEKGIIWTVTEDQAALIRRCFLDQIRAVATDCDVRMIGPVTTSPIKGAYRGELGDRQPDLL